MSPPGCLNSAASSIRRRQLCSTRHCREKEPYPGVKIERDVKYGAADRNLLDVFTPATDSSVRPVLIFVHGGAFVGGNKRGPGSPFYDNIMLWAVKNGFVGVNMTYRLAPQSP